MLIKNDIINWLLDSDPSILDSCPLSLKSMMLDKQYSKNEMIVYQGDYPKYVMIIMKGSVKVFHSSSTGKNYVIAMLVRYRGYTRRYRNID